jgi:antitoxin VapB
VALSLQDAETDRLAREVVKLTGESLSEAARTALAERLEREPRKRGRAKSLAERLDEIALHCASLPDYDVRTPDEIIGYDEYGVPR